MLLREATEITTVIFRGKKFQTSKFSIYPSELLWRHFHCWVKSFSGISRVDQNFARFDDYESVALRKFKDQESGLFQKIGGRTCKLLVSSRKRRSIIHWRFRHSPPTIPTTSNFSLPLRKRDISKYGFHFQRTQEAPLLHLLPSAVGWCSSRVHTGEQLNRRESRIARLNGFSEFISKALVFRQLKRPPEDQDWRKLLQPQIRIPEKFPVRIESDGRTLVWTVNRGREFVQITNRLGKDPSQTIILVNGIEWTGERQIFPNDLVTCKPLVPPSQAGAAEPPAEAEASAFSIFVKASGNPEAWTLRRGHEWKDFSQGVRDRLKFENFSASFNSEVWTADSQPPSANQAVMVSPRLKAGAPKGKKTVDWDPELREKVLGLVLSSDYDWTTKAKLSPEQINANDKVLEILEDLSRLESGPLHIGHLLRIVEDQTAVPFPNPAIQTQQKMGRDMTIRDVLMRLPISLWPPATTAQCFHPECGRRKTDMTKNDHFNKAHNWKCDFINNVHQKLNGRYLFDGESCLTATTASLLNVTAITATTVNWGSSEFSFAGRQVTVAWSSGRFLGTNFVEPASGRQLALNF
jgi:hypothetical protein